MILGKLYMIFCLKGGEKTLRLELSVVESKWSSRHISFTWDLLSLSRLSPLVLFESAIYIGLNVRNVAERGLGFGSWKLSLLGG